MVDWYTKTDYLRCNPLFSGRPRYDFVFIDSERGRRFARLVFVFVCHVNGCDYNLALVQGLDKSTRTTTRSGDKNLSIYRWHLRSRDRCEVIPLEDIVHGAVLIADTKYSGDYFVLDTLDADMFMRMKCM